MKTKKYLNLLLVAMLPILSAQTYATPAIDVIGKDFIFPNKIKGLPEKLSDFKGLQINYFETNDHVKMAYWEAGTGEPLIFIPGWTANGAEYINLMYMLSKKYHVYVLDPRNQGLSEKVNYGNRISRYSMDLHEFVNHLGISKANFCGWSMGASVLWGYIDLFGEESINKLVLIDEPISIYTHNDWSETERTNAGGMTTSVERMVAAFAGAPTNDQVVDMFAMERYAEKKSPYFQNSEAFTAAVIRNDMKAMQQVLFDHANNDWRDVVEHKITVPTAIFTGEYSHNLKSQQWAQSKIPNSKLYVYTKLQDGDHFLAFKNPVKFVKDLEGFLDSK